MPTPKEKTRVFTELPKSLIKQLDREAARLKKGGGRGSRSEALAEVVRRHFLGTYGGNTMLLSAHNEIRQDASQMKSYAEEKLRQKDIYAAKRGFLLTAAKELEALALLSDPDESTIRSSVIETLMHLKDGVGYKALPDVPGGVRTTIIRT